MAVVNNYMKEEQQRLQNQKAAAPAYSNYNVKPVSAQNRQAMQITTPEAQYALGKNPGTYKSRFSGTLDSIMNQILNPQEFKYEFNGDEMFKNYADLYTQYAKQGMLDTMGQAVGLTGGYGNSYAQQVGQQRYQQEILPIYDRGFDLRNMAYQGYRDEMGDLKDAYNAMMAGEQMDYTKYNNAVDQYRLQQQMDMAAAAGRGGRGGGPGPGNTADDIYYMNGKWYKYVNGKAVEVTPDPNQKYNIDYSWDKAVSSQSKAQNDKAQYKYSYQNEEKKKGTSKNDDKR